MLINSTLLAASVKETLHCRYFYAGVDVNWLNHSPDWYFPSLVLFSKALKQNDAQAKFEHDVLKLPYRQELNTDEKLSAFLGQIFRSSTFTPVVIYSNGKDFISRTQGEAPPEGFTVYEGVYSDYTYYHFISKGLYPIGDIQSAVRYFGFPISETTARHGIAHLGGFFENTSYAEHIKKVANFYVNSKDLHKGNPVRYRIAFFSESMWFPSATQKVAIKTFLDSIMANLPRVQLNDFQSAHQALSKISDTDLLQLAERVEADLPEVTPLGGGSRDYVERLYFRNQLESLSTTKANTPAERARQSNIRNQSQQGYDLLTSLSLKESMFALNLNSAVKNKDIAEIRSNLARILIQADAMIKFEIADWYEISTQQPTSASAQRLLEHLCRSGIYNPKLSLFKTYCI